MNFIKKLFLLSTILLSATDTLPTRKKRARRDAATHRCEQPQPAVPTKPLISNLAKLISTGCAKFYKAESWRTAAIRTVMAAGCLADGAINSTTEAGTIALALASLYTATAYDGMSTTRCRYLPNVIADAVATVASFDAGWMPITDTEIETYIRSSIGRASMAASAVGFIV